MKFIDEAKIFVKAGGGGNGCMSFRREKFVPRGGPNGGDGGKGGDVIIRASAGHRTLLDLKFRPRHVVRHGGHGKGSDMTGRNSADLIISVPVGTVIRDADSNEVLADLIQDGQDCMVARGGRGGRGNACFATSTNQAPRYHEEGKPGQERWIILELKLIADVGIIGLPNVGKSTFLARVTAARPKIADYPFTTLTPNLGVVALGEDDSFVMADIPGLIEGAHAGMGMGDRFLRHVERTAVLCHLIDISGEQGETAWKDYQTINHELEWFSPMLKEKPQVVAINKMDLPLTRDRIKKVVDMFAQKGINVASFSAATGEGINDVIGKIAEMLRLR
ncbi:MAG: GTPase ObgE [Syntrophales bacterium]|jgi:GTP-binding protein